MKKILSALLVIIIAFALFTVPLSTVGAEDNAVPAKITGLRITTANKKKQLKLTWDVQSKTAGYQIYRSDTGKTGSYEKIATVRNENAYVDKGLKSATTYYYKIRSFAKQNGKTLFGAFSKASLSTRITPSYAKKRFNATIKFLESFYSSGTNFDQMIIKTHTDAYGTYDDPHYLFEYKNCHTKEQLKKYLTKYVSSKVADTILKEKFYIINGKLYIWFPPMGAESAMVLHKTQITNCTYSDKKVAMRIGVFWKGTEGYDDSGYDYINQALVYENGRWVFGKEIYMTDWIYPYW